MVDCTIDGMTTHDGLDNADVTAARVAGWPDLTGSERKLGWAYTERANTIRAFEAASGVSDPDWYRRVLLRETRAGFGGAPE